MPMTVAITRNVSGRMRGYLASCMLEVAPGVYTAPRMSVAVRVRVALVIRGWFPHEQEASVVLLWADGRLAAGQGMECFGTPPYELVEYDGVILSHLAQRN